MRYVVVLHRYVRQTTHMEEHQARLQKYGERPCQGHYIFPPELLPALHDFWAVRNRVAHAEGFDVPDSTILSLISLGTELLKVVSTDKA